MFRDVRVGIQLPEVEREVRWPEYLAMAQGGRGGRVRLDLARRPPALRRSGARAVGGVDAAERAGGGDAQRCGSGRWWRAPGFHPPGVLAKMAATIDEVSGGRFVLGLGSGWNRREFDAFGIPYDKRVSAASRRRSRSSAACWRGERVTLDGTFHRADDVVLLPKPARRMPLMIGSNGPRMLVDRRSRTCDAWNTWWEDYGNTPGGLRRADRARSASHRATRSACMLVQLDGQPVEREPEVPAVEPSALRRAHPRAGRGRRRRGDRRRQPDHRALDPNARRSCCRLSDGLRDLLFLGRGLASARASRRRPASAPGARA